MLKFSQKLKTVTVSVGFSYRLNSSLAGESLGVINLDHDASKQLREEILAKAVAKEEEALLKEKFLRELREKTKKHIMDLNSTPIPSITERLKSLQKQLDLLPQDKTRQLDEQMEQFLFDSVKIPANELTMRPWIERLEHNDRSSRGEEEKALSQKIKSTTNSEFLNSYPNLKPTPDHKSYSKQELFLRYISHMSHSGLLGSKVSKTYVPSDDIEKPKDYSEVDIAILLAAGCHLGHAKALWRPSTQPFIYGEYKGIHLINLNETISSLRRAASVIENVAFKGGIILYVGTTRQPEQQKALEAAANRSDGYYVAHRWIPGTITNFTEVSKQIGGDQKIEVNYADEPTGKALPEDEDSLIKPDLIVLLNPVENRNCIGESIKLRIPTIGLCDTNMEPSLLTYPIPCNDDSMRASSLILGVLSKAANDGIQRRHEIYAAYKASL